MEEEEVFVAQVEIVGRMTYEDGQVGELVLGQASMTEDGDQNIEQMTTMLRGIADEFEAFNEEAAEADE